MIACRTEIAALIGQLEGIAGLYVQDARARLRLVHNEGRRFPAASLIKLPIYLEFLNGVRRGEVDPDARVTLRPPMVAGGSGVLQEAPPGSAHALHRIAELMITASDNTAANILIDLLGRERINAAARALGMQDTRLQRKMMDFDSRAAGRDNYTTPRDMHAFLDALLHPRVLPVDTAGKIIATLRQQALNTKLPAELPPEAVAAHKTGELDGVEHDAGLIFLGEQCCSVAVLTMDLRSNADGVSFCRKIGRLVCDAMRKA